MARKSRISYVIPVFNEEDNIEQLYRELTEVSSLMNAQYEIIFVDDCSTDRSPSIMERMMHRDRKVKVVSFSVNSGQSAAIASGMEVAEGDVIITMDADLQNDPHDIPSMMNIFNNGNCDMVAGWRVNRNDTFSRRIASRIGNAVRIMFTGDRIHDTGCSLKVMRASMAKRMKMYRGTHRFLTTLMRLEGATVVECKVNHRPRIHGASKYRNFRRGIEGLQDLFAIRWMIKKNLSPKLRSVTHEN